MCGGRPPLALPAPFLPPLCLSAVAVSPPEGIRCVCAAAYDYNASNLWFVQLRSEAETVAREALQESRDRMRNRLARRAAYWELRSRFCSWRDTVSSKAARRLASPLTPTWSALPPLNMYQIIALTTVS